MCDAVREIKQHTNMKTQTIKTWEGISSLAWALIGFALFQYWSVHHGFHSLFPAILSVLVVWWGVSLLLAFSGLRSRSRLGVLAGCATILGFLCFFWAVLRG